MQNTQKEKAVTVKKGDGQPRYVEVYRRLLERIRAMKPGEQLPAEEDLAEEYGVSRNTLRQALQILHEDRQIYKRKGAGTFVSGTPYPGRSELGNYQTGEESLRSLGLSVDICDIVITVEQADDITAEWLELEKTSPVYVVARVYADQTDHSIRYLYCEDFVPVGLEMDFSNFQKEEFIRAYERMGRASLCNITAAPAGKIYNKRLKVEGETPLLLLQQLVLDEQGKKLYLNKSYINTEIPELSLVISRK